MQRTPPLWQKVKKNWRVSWWKWKSRVKNLAYRSTFRKQRSWHPVPSFHGKEMEKEWKQWQTLLLGGSTTTSDCNCSHEIKIYLLLGRKFVTNLDSILKSRDVTLSTKVGLVKAVVFLVIMTEWLHFHFSLSCIGEGNGNSLQYSCLENPRDGEAWWAAIWGCTE